MGDKPTLNKGFLEELGELAKDPEALWHSIRDNSSELVDSAYQGVLLGNRGSRIDSVRHSGYTLLKIVKPAADTAATAVGTVSMITSPEGVKEMFMRWPQYAYQSATGQEDTSGRAKSVEEFTSRVLNDGIVGHTVYWITEKRLTDHAQITNVVDWNEALDQAKRKIIADQRPYTVSETKEEIYRILNAQRGHGTALRCYTANPDKPNQMVAGLCNLDDVLEKWEELPLDRINMSRPSGAIIPPSVNLKGTNATQQPAETTHPPQETPNFIVKYGKALAIGSGMLIVGGGAISGMLPLALVGGGLVGGGILFDKIRNLVAPPANATNTTHKPAGPQPSSPSVPAVNRQRSHLPAGLNDIDAFALGSFSPSVPIATKSAQDLKAQSTV